MRRLFFIALLPILLAVPEGRAQQPDTTLRERIDSTVFSAERNLSVVQGSLVNELKVKLEEPLPLSYNSLSYKF